MALQLRRGETRSFGKMVVASLVAMAFTVQALIVFNGHQLVFAVSSANTLTAPTTPYPADNGAIGTNDFWFTWSAVPGAESYEWQSSTSGAKNADGTLTNVLWHGDYQGVQPTSPTLRSVGANGTWYWQVRAVGANNTKGPWSPVWKMTIDLNLPDAPSNLSWKTSGGQIITDGGITNAYAGTASWQDATPNKVNHYIYKYWNDIVGDPYKTGSEYTTSTTGISLGGVFNQGDGVHHFCVAAVDTAGNASTCTPFTITYDHIPPMATFTFSNNNSAALTNSDVTVTMTTNEPAQTPVDWTRVDSTHFTRVYSHNGRYQVFVTDLAGNTSTAQKFQVKRIDHNAPTISGVSEGAIIAGSVNLSIFDPKYEGVDGFDKNHGLTIDGTTVKAANGPNKTYLYTVTGEGSHTVIATDKAGNSTTLSFTIDTTAPTVTGVNVDHNPTNQSQLSVSGTVTDANLQDYTMSVFQADQVTPVSPALDRGGNVNVENGVLGTFDISQLPDGQYWVRVWARDMAGNETGTASPIFASFVIDRTAPKVAITNFTRNTNGTYTITGTTDDSSDVTVTIDDQTSLSATPSNGVWTVTSGILVDGKHGVVATSADALGNQQSATSSFTTSSGNSTVEKFAGAIAAAAPARLFTTVPVGTTPAGPVNGDQSVLGDHTTVPSGKSIGNNGDNDSTDKAVKGDSTTRTQSGAPAFMGLAWYWWLLIVVVVLGLWRVIAARSRKSAE